MAERRATATRRIMAPVVATGVAFGLLLGAVGAGLSVSDVALLASLPRGALLDYSRGPASGIAPLQSSFVSEVLGTESSVSSEVPGEGGAGAATGGGRAPRTITPPGANDDFADAVTIEKVPPTYTDRTSTSGATVEPGEPLECSAINATVWYRYAPRKDQGLSVDTFGSTFHTAINVYKGRTLDGLKLVTCSSGARGETEVALWATRGATYHVQVGGPFGGGDLALRVRQVEFRPANDNFARAASVSSVPFSHETNNGGASTEPEFAPPSCARTSADVWYRHTPDADTVLAADAFGTSFPTVLAVYSWGSGRLKEVGCDRMPIGAYPPRVVFRASAGAALYFRLGSNLDALEGADPRGTITFNLRRWRARPANDEPARATSVTRVPFRDLTHTFGAGEASEPQPTSCGAGVGVQKTVWYKFTADQTTQLIVNTHGSRQGDRLDTVLTVYRGTSASDLVEVACNDQGPEVSEDASVVRTGSPESTVVFLAQEGQTYWIQAGSATAQVPTPGRGVVGYGNLLLRVRYRFVD